MIQVTVLMPIYNAKRFLKESIESLFSQTSNQWKLICIDDGSTDSSKAIVEEYCKKDSRIKLLCQENAGPAVARARAIEIADTEYVSILDSDDAYAPDYVEKMLTRAEETNADCIVPDVEFISVEGEKRPNLFNSRGLSCEKVIEDGEKAFAMTLPWQLHGWQMIRTSLAKEYYTIEQVKYSRFNSDEYITRLLYLKSNLTALCSAVYKYRLDSCSITRTPSLKMMDYLVTNLKLLRLADTEGLNKDIILSIYNDFYFSCRRLKNNVIPELNQSDRLIAQKILRSKIMDFKTSIKWRNMRQAPIRTKIKFLLFLLFYKF